MPQKQSCAIHVCVQSVGPFGQTPQGCSSDTCLAGKPGYSNKGEPGEEMQIENRRRRANTSLRRVNFNRSWLYLTWKKRENQEIMGSKSQAAHRWEQEDPSYWYSVQQERQTRCWTSVRKQTAAQTDFWKSLALTLWGLFLLVAWSDFDLKSWLYRKCLKSHHASWITPSVHFCSESYTISYRPKTFFSLWSTQQGPRFLC